MTARIAYVITDSGIGGTEKALLSILRGLDRDRFDPVGVVVIKGRRQMAERWEAAGVSVTTIGMGRWPTPQAFVRLRRHLDKLKPDVVHAFLYHAIQMSRFIKKSHPWKLITSPRVNYRFASKPALLIDRWLRERDELSICESEAGRVSLIDLGYPPNRLMVAPNGVDSTAFQRDDTARYRLRQEWGVGNDELVVGALGRLHKQKGFDLLIDAIDRLSKTPVRFRLMIAGTGPERPDLEAMANAKASRVTFLGERTDVAKLLSAFDIFVQSSRYEGMSNALLEALAAGLPCVATAVDGTMDIARDGQNMLLVRPNDALALAVAIGYLLERPDERRRLESNAIISARESSVDRMVAAFHDAYEAVASAPPEANHVRSIS